MTVPHGPHKVDGLQLKKGPWPYEVQEEHKHGWLHRPKAGSNSAQAIQDRKGRVVVTFHGVASVTLHAGYAWDGNSGPAVNTLTCLRASALHDAWCQAMGAHIFENNFRNWAAGASEYRRICVTDGMFRLRAGWRYLAVLGYGGWKKVTGRLRPEATKP